MVYMPGPSLLVVSLSSAGFQRLGVMATACVSHENTQCPLSSPTGQSHSDRRRGSRLAAALVGVTGNVSWTVAAGALSSSHSSGRPWSASAVMR